MNAETGFVDQLLMRTGSVVVVPVFLQHTCDMSLTEDKELIQAFMPNRALGHHIGIWRSKERADDFEAFGDENLVEAGCEFAVAVMNEKAHRLGFVAQIPDELTRLLGDPSAIG